VKQGRISQTALKVGLSLITLAQKDDWAERLPPGLVEMTERLILAAGARGYGPGTLRASKKPWMLRLYRFQDRALLPRQFEGFGHRKIFMDRQVRDAIAVGARQVLIVGAGFDTLCLRRAPEFADVQFFEVDHPATSAAKAKGVDELGRPANITLIAADLGERPLSKVMAESDRWDASKRSVLVAEGLLQYLDTASIHGLLREAAACTPPGSRLALTHMLPEVSPLSRRLARLIGEPFLSFVASEDLPEFVQGTGWSVISPIDKDGAHGMERYALLERA
jgi:methyltransferase (TIGR00027 family)